MASNQATYQEHYGNFIQDPEAATDGGAGRNIHDKEFWRQCKVCCDTT